MGVNAIEFDVSGGGDILIMELERYLNRGRSSAVIINLNSNQQ